MAEHFRLVDIIHILLLIGELGGLVVDGDKVGDSVGLNHNIPECDTDVFNQRSS